MLLCTLKTFSPKRIRNSCFFHSSIIKKKISTLFTSSSPLFQWPIFMWNPTFLFIFSKFSNTISSLAINKKVKFFYSLSEIRTSHQVKCLFHFLKSFEKTSPDKEFHRTKRTLIRVKLNLVLIQKGWVTRLMKLF